MLTWTLLAFEEDEEEAVLKPYEHVRKIAETILRNC